MQYGPIRTLRPSEASGETIAVGWITGQMSTKETFDDEVFLRSLSIVFDKDNGWIGGGKELLRQLRFSRSVLCPSRAKKSPAPIAWSRAYTWRRPTLTRPIVSLPLALQRFTSGFGMGPGGSTALWSPEVNPVSSGLGLWRSELWF